MWTATPATWCCSANRPGGARSASWSRQPPVFFYMDVPESWKRQHIRAWADHLRGDRGWRMSHRVKLERRQQLMGYVPDPATGTPLKRRYLMFRFRSPNLMKDALRDLRKREELQGLGLTRGFLQEHRDLFDYEEHWAPLWEAQPHMTDGRRFPALSKFQSLHGIVPMSWIKVAPGGAEEAELPELVRNLPEVVRVRADQVELVADEKQLTATRTLIAWDIETVSDHAEDEDDTFPRPWRPGSYVINIGLRETKALGTADGGAGEEEDGAEEEDGGAGDEEGTLTVRREVLVLGGTAPSGKCRIREFGTEPELLCYFLHNVLPRADVVVDYNGASFDWPYVFIRVQLFLFFGGLAVGGEARILRRYRRARAAALRPSDAHPRFLDAGRPGAFAQPRRRLCIWRLSRSWGAENRGTSWSARFVESGDRLSPPPSRRTRLLSLYDRGRGAAGAPIFFLGASPARRPGPRGALWVWIQAVLQVVQGPPLRAHGLPGPSAALPFRGIFALDMLKVCKKTLTLERYGLDQVAKHLGQGGKDGSFGFDWPATRCLPCGAGGTPRSAGWWPSTAWSTWTSWSGCSTRSR